MGNERSIAQEIRTALRQRFGNANAVPRGTDTALAQEFGTTKQWVQVIRIGMGYELARRPQRLCSCGRKISRTARLCRACRRVTVPCTDCGRPVVRQRSRYLARFQNGATSANIFCNKGCQARWMGKQNRGRHRRPPEGGAELPAALSASETLPGS